MLWVWAAEPLFIPLKALEVGRLWEDAGAAVGRAAAGADAGRAAVELAVFGRVAGDGELTGFEPEPGKVDVDGRFAAPEPDAPVVEPPHPRASRDW